MEMECIGNTQIIHMEETGITKRTIGLVCATPITVIGAIFISIAQWVLLSDCCKLNPIAMHLPMRKNFGNHNGVCRYVWAIRFHRADQ